MNSYYSSYSYFVENHTSLLDYGNHQDREKLLLVDYINKGRGIELSVYFR